MPLEAIMFSALRIHVLPGPVDLDEAASFLVSSLLLSHGIRRNTVAIVELDIGLLAAPGWSLRQLRPDLETATGWVRAVLYKGKARGLGALILRGIRSGDILQTAASLGFQAIRTCSGHPQLAGWELGGKAIIVHGEGPGGRCWLSAPCRPPCRAAVSNIILDRIGARLNSRGGRV